MQKKQGGFVNVVSNSRHICNNVDLIFTGVIFVLMITTTTAIKCYVCGTGAEVPFEETKDLSINATQIKQTIHSSCEEFDRVDPSEKERYAVNCPKDFHGCMLQIDEDDVVRTCSKYSIDDCKTANKIHYCYCNTRDYCNIENAEAIKERLEVLAEKPVHRLNSEAVEDDEDSAESSGMEDNSREVDNSKDHDHHRHHLTSTPPSTVTVQNSITIAETTAKTMHNSAINNHSTKTCFILFITFITSIVFL